jgi:hypothetical protein
MPRPGRATAGLLVAVALTAGVAPAPAAQPTASGPPVTSRPPLSSAAPAPAAAQVGAPGAAAGALWAPGRTSGATAAALAVPVAKRSLPGGGTRIFAGKTYVALYGHPGTRVLGVLGEQGTAATIRRAKRLAASYRRHTKRTVVPALEIIATVASASAGADGNYSAEAPVRKLRPLVNAAGRAGVYVVLDLQPGRSSFLRQAKRYRSLLRKPHVGLALDPEWRLKPGQRHLRQIGSVRAKEINRVSAWLARLTRKSGLPQKMLLLHQFRTSMITQRSTLVTSRPEVALVIQMDGLGSQPAKRATWRAIRRGAPKGIKFGWKNFIDEDRPMIGPRATMRIRPQPRWVSYQ